MIEYNEHKFSIECSEDRRFMLDFEIENDFLEIYSDRWDEGYTFNKNDAYKLGRKLYRLYKPSLKDRFLKFGKYIKYSFIRMKYRLPNRLFSFIRKFGKQKCYGCGIFYRRFLYHKNEDKCPNCQLHMDDLPF